MSELYISDMVLRESRPRSRRLRDLGIGGRSSSSEASESLNTGLVDDLFEKVIRGEDSDGNPVYAIHAKYLLFSDYDIIAGGSEDSEESSPTGALYLLADIAKSSDGEHVGQSSGGPAAVAGQILAYDGTHWYAKDESEGGSSVSWGAVSGNTVQLSVAGASKALLLSGALDDYLTSQAAADSYMGKNAVSWGTVSGNTVQLSVAGVSNTLLLSSALGDYLPISGGTMSGPINMSGSHITLCGYPSADDCALYADSYEHVYLKAFRNIYLNTSSGHNVYINGYAAAVKTDIPTKLSDLTDDLGNKPTHTHDNRYAGINGNTSQAFSAKSISIPSTNIQGFLKIGDAYVWYDPNSKALCVTAASGSSQAISIKTSGDFICV